MSDPMPTIHNILGNSQRAAAALADRPVNHIAEANKVAVDMGDRQDARYADRPLVVADATLHATLAIAEQARIANILTLLPLLVDHGKGHIGQQLRELGNGIDDMVFDGLGI
jgi:hypothetical protein